MPFAAKIFKAEADLTITNALKKKAFAELLTLKTKKTVLEDKIIDLEKKSRELNLKKKVFWRERNAFALTLFLFQNNQNTLNAAYDHNS